MDLGFANIGDGCNDVSGDNMYRITTSPQGWHYQRNMLWQFPDVTLWCAQHSTAQHSLAARMLRRVEALVSMLSE